MDYEQDYKRALEALSEELEEVTQAKNRQLEEANLSLMELHSEVDVQREAISRLNEELERKNELLATKDKELESKDELIASRNNEIEGKESIIKVQMDTINDLVEQNDTKDAKIEELISEVARKTKIEEELNEKIGDLMVEINNLEKDKENLSAAPPSNSKIIEEDDELVPVTPPSRQYPRESIGQWSVNRMKNNMSVKSLISSMEKGKRQLK